MAKNLTSAIFVELLLHSKVKYGIGIRLAFLPLAVIFNFITVMFLYTKSIFPGNLNRHKKDKHNLDANTECTDEEAAKILNEMSGKKLTDSDNQDCGEGSPAPKKKRKSFPRKTVTEEGGSEVDKEIEAAWQKGVVNGENSQEEDEDGSPQDLLNQILSGTVPGIDQEELGKQNDPEHGDVATDGVQTLTSVENADGSTEWIAYIPLTGEEGLQPGATHEVSITLVSSTEEGMSAVRKSPQPKQNTQVNTTDAEKETVAMPGRRRKRKPINFGDDFMTNDVTINLSVAPEKDLNSSNDNVDGKRSKRGKNKAAIGQNREQLSGVVQSQTDACNSVNCSAADVNTAKTKKVQRGRAGKKANLASVLATKLVKSQT